MIIKKDFLSHIGYKKGQKIAVAVSGGSDSLALLFIACEIYGSQNIIALTFNHKLRKEAYEEAMFVKSQCQRLKCQHVLLQADDKNILKASQNSARKGRYAHLLSYCHAHHIRYLFLAHHLNDQIETYYIRLYQKSHLWGMAGMPMIYRKGNVFIVRPFLDTDSSYFKNYLKNKKITWVEDPSNQNEKYLRVKIRKLLKEKKLEIPHLKLIQSYRQNISSMMKTWLDKYSQTPSAGLISIDKNQFNKLHKEFRLHLLRFCLQAIGGSEYSVSLKEISKKYADILSADLFSLNHCLIFSDSHFIYIQHEYRKKNKERATFVQEGYILYDNRFHIFYPKAYHIQVGYIGDLKKTCTEGGQELIKYSHQKRYRYVQSLPFVKYNENKYIFPMIQGLFWKQNDFYIQYEDSIRSMACQKYFIDLSF